MKVCCPKCGGGLVIEATGQYGIIRKISPTGTICKKQVKVLYGIDGDFYDMVYCPTCHWHADGKFINEKGKIIPDWEVEP